MTEALNFSIFSSTNSLKFLFFKSGIRFTPNDTAENILFECDSANVAFAPILEQYALSYDFD